MPTKKPAKRPAAAPEVVYVVIGKHGEVWSASAKKGWTEAERNYYANHYECSGPFSIVKYRLDQPPRGAARRK